MAVTVGCCVGVGFLSGKEAQLFVGSYLNAALFALVFGGASFAVREFCRKRHCPTVEDMGRQLPCARGAFAWVVAFCSFVCMCTVTAGLNCLSELCGFGLGVPLFAFVGALAAAMVCRGGLRLLKAANLLSLAMAAVLLVALLCGGRGGSSMPSVPCHRPAVYALFSVTASLGVSTRLGAQSSAKQNAICSFGSALIAALLMCLVLQSCGTGELPTLSGIEGWLKPFAVATLLLCGATGLAANALPVTQLLQDVLPDATLCALLVFGMALALSLLGLELAMRIGYAAIAAVGALTVLLIALAPARSGCSRP